jgi:hypothetical protein
MTVALHLLCIHMYKSLIGILVRAVRIGILVMAIVVGHGRMLMLMFPGIIVRIGNRAHHPADQAAIQMLANQAAATKRVFLADQAMADQATANQIFFADQATANQILANQAVNHANPALPLSIDPILILSKEFAFFGRKGIANMARIAGTIMLMIEKNLLLR